MTITTQVTGEEKLREFFTKAPAKLRQELMREIDRMAIVLQARMKMKVSGDVLNVRTGRLRRSISVTKGQANQDGYSVTVGTNVKYAAAHEYGFNGTVTVPAHMRMVRTAWGRPVRAPTQHMVRQHSRRLNLPERSFARSSYEELRPQMSAQLQTFVTNALRRYAP